MIDKVRQSIMQNNDGLMDSDGKNNEENSKDGSERSTSSISNISAVNTEASPIGADDNVAASSSDTSNVSDSKATKSTKVKNTTSICLIGHTQKILIGTLFEDMF